MAKRYKALQLDWRLHQVVIYIKFDLEVIPDIKNVKLCHKKRRKAQVIWQKYWPIGFLDETGKLFE
jgi:hypothetical protein